MKSIKIFQIIFFSLISFITSIVIWIFNTGMTLSFLHEPLNASGDPLISYVFAKRFIQGTWYTPNLELGFPIGADWGHLNNFSEIIHLLEIYFLSFFSDNPITVINLFIVLSSGIVALFSYLLFRLYTFNFLALILAISISLLPYRIFRAPGHFYLTEFSGFLVFLITVTLIYKYKTSTKNKFVLLFISSLYLSWTGQYYAFFALVCLFSLLLAYLIKREFNLYFVYFISYSFFTSINLILQKLIISRNTYTEIILDISERNFTGSELYAGSFFSLFLPSPYSGLVFLSNTRKTFDSITIFNGYEVNNYNSLAGVTTITFTFILLFLLIINFKFSSKLNFIENIYFRNFILFFLVLLFFYFPTGLGSIFSFFINPIIRGWGRIFPLLIVISICIFLICFKSLFEKSRFIKYSTVIFFTLLVLFDQVLGNYRYNFSAGNEAKRNSVLVSQDIEKHVPKNCALLLYPLIPFPEVPPINKMQDYDHFWVYLYTKSYSFSYGAVKNTSAFEFQTRNLNLSNLAELKKIGFCAIVIDTYAFQSEQEVLNLETKYALLPLNDLLQSRWKIYLLEF